MEKSLLGACLVFTLLAECLLWPQVSDAAFSSPPTGLRRVVTLTPALAEIVFLLEGQGSQGQDRLVGSADGVEIPGVTSIGPYDRFNPETVLSLKPDLVLATSGGNPRFLVERLRSLDLRVEIFRDESLEQIETTVLDLAKLLDRTSEGARVVARWNQQWALLSKRDRTEPVAVVVAMDPWVVVGGKSFISEGLSRAGLDNIYRDHLRSHLTVTLESLLARKPKRILFLSGTNGHGLDQSRAQTLCRNFKMRCEFVHDDRLMRPTPAFGDAVTEILKRLGPS